MFTTRGRLESELAEVAGVVVHASMLELELPATKLHGQGPNATTTCDGSGEKLVPKM
jgi:hypothetical protein